MALIHPFPGALEVLDRVEKPPAGNGPVIGYIDGRVSKWQPEELNSPYVVGRVSVLANPLGEIFDLERGNAVTEQVSNALYQRYSAGLPSVLYMDYANLHDEKSPYSSLIYHPGVVGIWVADWGCRSLNSVASIEALGPKVIGVQYRSTPMFDVSCIVKAKWPFLPRGIPTAPPPSAVGTMVLKDVRYRIFA